MKRSMMCGEVRAEDVGRTIVLQGWVHTVRDHGGLIFVDLRDRAGLVQVIVNPATAAEAFEVASGLHDEYVVEVHGQVERRPPGSEPSPAGSRGAFPPVDGWDSTLAPYVTWCSAVPGRDGLRSARCEGLSQITRCQELKRDSLMPCCS